MPFGPLTRSLPLIWSRWQAEQVCSNGATAMMRLSSRLLWQVEQVAGMRFAGSFFATSG